MEVADQQKLANLKAYNLSVWSPNHDPIFAIFKGHYKLTLKGIFFGGFEREKSASYAYNCRYRVFVPKTLESLLLTIFLKKSQDSVL